MKLAPLVSLAAIALMATVHSARMGTAQIVAHEMVAGRAMTVEAVQAVVLEIVQTVVHVRSVMAMTAHALHVHRAKAR